MTPSTGSNLANCPTSKTDTTMIGASVRSGAMATFSPSRKPKRMVWATTTVVVGPGVKPPARPKTQPDAMNTRTSIIADSQRKGVALRRAFQNRKGMNILVLVI